MKCDDILPILEPFFDDACTQAESELVSLHLETCSPCLSSLRAIESENHFYARNVERVELPSSFWSDVVPVSAFPLVREGEAFSRSRAASFAQWLREWRLAPLPAFAILVFAVGLTIAVTTYLASTHQRSTDPPLAKQLVVPPTTQVPPPKVTQATASLTGAAASGRAARVRRTAAVSPLQRESASVLVREAEEKYLAAIAILERDASRHRAVLDDGERAQLELTLTGVDRAIASTRKAVKAAPGDPIAVQYMLTAYSRKVDVLRQMVAD